MWYVVNKLIFLNWCELDHGEMKAIILTSQDKNDFPLNSPNLICALNCFGGSKNWYLDFTHEEIEQ